MLLRLCLCEWHTFTSIPLALSHKPTHTDTLDCHSNFLFFLSESTTPKQFVRRTFHQPSWQPFLDCQLMYSLNIACKIYRHQTFDKSKISTIQVKLVRERIAKAYIVSVNFQKKIVVNEQLIAYAIMYAKQCTEQLAFQMMNGMLQSSWRASWLQLLIYPDGGGLRLWWWRPRPQHGQCAFKCKNISKAFHSLLPGIHTWIRRHKSHTHTHTHLSLSPMAIVWILTVTRSLIFLFLFARTQSVNEQYSKWRFYSHVFIWFFPLFLSTSLSVISITNQ